MPDTTVINGILNRSYEIQEQNPDSALFLARKAYLLSQKINYQDGIGTASMRLGTILNTKGKGDSALLYLRSALSIRKKSTDRKGEANTADAISNLYNKRGNKDSAFHYLFYALRIYEKQNDSVNIGAIYNELCDASFKYGDTKTALKYIDNSLGIFTRLGDLYFLSKTNKLYGIIYYYTSEYDKALTYFIKAAEIDEARKDELEVARTSNYLGLCYQALGNELRSRFYLNKALLYFTKLDRVYDKAEVLYNIGFCFYEKEKWDSAAYYFEKSGKMLENSGKGDLTLRVFNALSEVYSSVGDYHKAYDYQTKYIELNDSLINEEKIKQIAEMHAKYDSEKQEQQIRLLEEQHKSKVAQRNFFIAGSAALLLILFAFSFYYLQRNKIAKKNEQIAQEKISSLLKEQEIKSYDAMIEGQEEERKRIATDLHDRLGSMLSTVKILFGNLNEKIDTNQVDNQKHYTKASNLLDEAVLEVRRIAQNLSTGMVITFGLIPALEEFCESINDSKILKCKFLCYGIEERMEQHIEIGIFRMMQEIVNNVLKHAKAKHLTIQLNRTEDSITVTVEDDGSGFNTHEKSRGMGLKNLEARAHKMAGTYNIDSKPGHGTISIIEIPLTHDTSINS